MAMQTNFDKIKIAAMTHPIAKTGDFNSGSVDLKGYNACTVCVYFGADALVDANNYWDCSLEESDDDSTWTAVAAADTYNGTATAANAFGVVNSTTEDNAIYCLGYLGAKRYVRAVVDENGTVSSVIAVFAILSEASDLPVGNTVLSS